MPAFPSFIGGSYRSQSPIADCERLVNMYVEMMEVEGAQMKTRSTLYTIPGVESFASATTAPGRGSFEHDGRAFVVIGPTFFELTSGGTLTSRGTVAVDQYPATMATNGDGGGQILIASGNNGYCFTLATNAFAQVRTGGTRMVGQLDGFGLALDADTSTLFISDPLDFTTWDPTQFAQRSIQPDPWISLIVLDRYIWLLGSKTSEVWYNAGSSPFPFAAHPSGLVQYGCAAPFSPEVVAGTLIWLSSTANGSGLVVRTAGFSPEAISSFPLQVAFATYTDLDAAIGDTHDHLGHTFYVLTIGSEATWAYDATTTLQLPHASRWAERGTWISEENTFEAWRPLYHLFAFGEHLTLDRETGEVWRLSETTATDVDGRPLRCVREAPAIGQFNQRTSYPAFELLMEPGLGTLSGQGSDPQVMLQTSNDGGKTWGDERWRSAGKMGEYLTRVRWLRCGSAWGWNRVFRVVLSDPFPRRILGADLEVA
jgi:hypothetical protein